MNAAANAGHKISAVVVLNVSEDDVRERFAAAKKLGDRGDRADDSNEEIFEKRLEEFRTKTAPVLMHYQTLGLLVPVNGDQSREDVFAEMVDKLYTKALGH
jgi:adenylate kinase family enzyme